MTQKSQTFICEKNNREKMAEKNSNIIVMKQEATLKIPSVMTGDKGSFTQQVIVDEHTTMLDVLQQVSDPNLRKKLFDHRGDPNSFLHVMLNGKAIEYSADGMNTIVKGSDKIDVMPKVSGGSI